MKVRKGNCRIFSIYKKNITENVFIELKDDTIRYFKEFNNNGPAKDFKFSRAPKLISDVNFVTQIIQELYNPVKEDIRHYKEEFESIEVESLTRVKNTATYTLRVLDEDIYAEFDLYITQTPQTIKEFCNQVINEVENYLKDNSAKDEESINIKQSDNISEINDEELKKIIEDFIGNNDPYWNIPVYNIVKKIIDLPNETMVTIAYLIKYNPNESFVEPLEQGKIANLVKEICKKLYIELEENRDMFEGLAYYIPFKKNNTNTEKEAEKKPKNGIIRIYKADGTEEEREILLPSEPQIPKLKCPICENLLMYFMPGATRLYCKKCEKYFKNNGFNVGADITLDELIKNSTLDSFWQMTLKQFFSKLSNVSEDEKIEFFKKLTNDKEKFNEFSKEIMKNQNSNEVFNKYNI